MQLRAQVPVGAAQATTAGGQTYVLTWAQDEDGHLDLQGFCSVTGGNEGACAPGM